MIVYAHEARVFLDVNSDIMIEWNDQEQDYEFLLLCNSWI